MDQQEQTLKYFNRNAMDWQGKASVAGFSVIENRHNTVLEVMKGFSVDGLLLDVGCGTGQLVIEASRRGWRAVGVDYATSMIDICKSNNQEAGTHAEFHCASIFRSGIAADAYDVISAQGFIEYISLVELDKFLELARIGLKNDGALVLGSRNRLFNLHSLNEFSSLELRLNTMDKLLHESIIMQSSACQAEAIEKLSGLDYEYSYPETHPKTGIKVETRFQFSPADLIGRLRKHGFRPTRIFPVHFHGLPLTSLKNDRLSMLHTELADLVSRDFINSQAFVPYSSSFVIEAKRD
ncbi:MAG: class I SAM-dependent methyltransferase [Sterolibacterium sp.]|jgi:2-polyprenyl-3-methyl-5-hydroxy-6-metoxy-1,4-benzoquinol methylase